MPGSSLPFAHTEPRARVRTLERSESHGCFVG